MRINYSLEFRHLRKIFDGSDPTMMIKGGCGFRTRRGGARRRLKTPSCFRDNASVQEFLLRVFPKLKTDPHQRRTAAKWGAIIILYFRDGMSEADAAFALTRSPRFVARTVQRIRLAIAGQRQDGKPRTGRPRGRPKRIAAPGEVLPKAPYTPRKPRKPRAAPALPAVTIPLDLEFERDDESTVE